jgi:hypothetical protein
MPLPFLLKTHFNSVISRPITVLVGKSEVEFFTHETLVRVSSAFFENALSKERKGNQDRVIRLPDVFIEAFPIYAKWLYSGRFYAVKENDEVRHKSTGTIETREFTRWDDCYERGNFLQDVDFKDAMIDVMIEHMIDDNMLHLSLPDNIYKNSGPDSAHRKFAVDTVIHLWGEELLVAKYLFRKLHPVGYLNDLIVAMAEHLREGMEKKSIAKFFRDKDPCDYHVHIRLNKPCYKTRPWFKF